MLCLAYDCLSSSCALIKTCSDSSETSPVRLPLLLCRACLTGSFCANFEQIKYLYLIFLSCLDPWSGKFEFQDGFGLNSLRLRTPIFKGKKEEKIVFFVWRKIPLFWKFQNPNFQKMFYHLAKFATKNQKIFELPSFYVVKIFYKGKFFFKKYERAGAQSKKPYNTLFWGNPD